MAAQLVAVSNDGREVANVDRQRGGA